MSSERGLSYDDHWRAGCGESSHAPFGNRPTEKDRTQRHLAGGLVHSVGRAEVANRGLRPPPTRRAPGGAGSLLVKVQSDRPQAGSGAEGEGNASLGAVGRWTRWLRVWACRVMPSNSAGQGAHREVGLEEFEARLPHRAIHSAIPLKSAATFTIGRTFLTGAGDAGLCVRTIWTNGRAGSSVRPAHPQVSSIVRVEGVSVGVALPDERNSGLSRIVTRIDHLWYWRWLPCGSRYRAGRGHSSW